MGIKRQTKSVKAILSFFENSHDAISVVDLVGRVKNNMNKTTVYRILDRLEKEGLIHSFTDTDGLKCYAKCLHCTDHQHNEVHSHFECKDCGKVESVDIPMPLPKINNRHIESADVMLIGQCADCYSKD